MDNAEILKKAKELAAVKGAPRTDSSLWIMTTNPDPGSTWIVLPQGGVLWIVYEYSNAMAQSIMVWHQGGTTTPINLGGNEVAVAPGDMIMYTLGNPGEDMIKLVYQYI